MNTKNNNEKPFFNQLEARVIASLMEKHLTTPNNYPLTINSLILACNQKSNREPVMNLTEGQVGHTVNALKDRGLVGVDYGGRSNHISHRVMNVLQLNTKTQAILTVLMVRKPQTLNDIKARTNRMADFASIEEISELLNEMMQRDKPLVVRIPKSAGAREDRYSHLLCGEVDRQPKTVAPIIQQQSNSDAEITKLQQRLTELEAKIEKLMQLLD
ncbi:MAG TPA: DUF480 domain-containing protein [Oceanospirillales bacterium]|nr:DUF480 domain-containing protein [Oceanospirillales bacterium]